MGIFARARKCISAYALKHICDKPAHPLHIVALRDRAALVGTEIDNVFVPLKPSRQPASRTVETTSIFEGLSLYRSPLIDCSPGPANVRPGASSPRAQP